MRFPWTGHHVDKGENYRNNHLQLEGIRVICTIEVESRLLQNVETIYKSKRRHISNDGNLNIHHIQNLKSGKWLEFGIGLN